MPINYKTRLQKWFEVDKTTKYYLDKNTFFYAARYKGVDNEGNIDAIGHGVPNRIYLVKNLTIKAGIAVLDAPNPPYETPENA